MLVIFVSGHKTDDDDDDDERLGQMLSWKQRLGLGRASASRQLFA